MSNWNGGPEGNAEEEYGEDQLITKLKTFLKRHRNLLLDLNKHTQGNYPIPGNNAPTRQ